MGCFGGAVDAQSHTIGRHGVSLARQHSDVWTAHLLHRLVLAVLRLELCPRVDNLLQLCGRARAHRIDVSSVSMAAHPSGEREQPLTRLYLLVFIAQLLSALLQCHCRHVTANVVVAG